jgi:hypothetical protein
MLIVLDNGSQALADDDRPMGSAEDGYGGAVRAVDTGETLTRDDKLILQLHFQTSQMMPPLVPLEAHPICALIYRAIGAYPNLPLSKKVAHLLLQELGLIPPWKERRFIVMREEVCSSLYQSQFQSR